MRKKLILAGIPLLTGVLMSNSAGNNIQNVNYIKPQSVNISKTKKDLTKVYTEKPKQESIGYSFIFNKRDDSKLIKDEGIECSFNYKTSNFWNDEDRVLLARMLLGEGEGCSRIEKIAIAWTAINRANDNQEWNGKTLKEAILKPYQYSCFNKENNQPLKNPLAYNSKEFYECLYLSRKILAGEYKDPTKGATFYFNPKRVKRTPAWVNGLERVGRINRSYHVFYREKKNNKNFTPKNLCEKDSLPKNNRL